LGKSQRPEGGKMLAVCLNNSVGTDESEGDIGYLELDFLMTTLLLSNLPRQSDKLADCRQR
jgi:hypothetical protein